MPLLDEIASARAIENARTNDAHLLRQLAEENLDGLLEGWESVVKPLQASEAPGGNKQHEALYLLRGKRRPLASYLA